MTRCPFGLNLTIMGEKRGELNTAFKRRWCCLRHATREGDGRASLARASVCGAQGLYQRAAYSLDYFASPNEVVPRGSIPLASVQRIELVSPGGHARGHGFALHTPLRVYMLAPGSGDEAADAASTREWVHLLVHAKARQLMADADDAAGAAEVDLAVAAPSRRMTNSSLRYTGL